MSFFVPFSFVHAHTTLSGQPGLSIEWSKTDIIFTLYASLFGKGKANLKEIDVGVGVGVNVDSGVTSGDGVGFVVVVGVGVGEGVTVVDGVGVVSTKLSKNFVIPLAIP